MNMSPRVAWSNKRRVTAQALQERCSQINDQLRQLEEVQLKAIDVAIMAGMFRCDRENEADMNW